MGQTADDIRQELDRKRHELSHDVERIEEKVRSTFDINRYIEEQPLVATGVAVLAGFVLGNMVGGGGNDKQRHGGYGSYSGDYGGYGGHTPRSGFYGGASGGYQPSHYQRQGHGMMTSVKDSVKQGFQSTAGNRDVENMMSSVTAALTALLMEKAREVLDQNLPGFSEKFEQAQQQQRDSQDRALSATNSAGGADMDRSMSSAGSYGGSTGSSGLSGTSGASGSERLGPSPSSFSRSM